MNELELELNCMEELDIAFFDEMIEQIILIKEKIITPLLVKEMKETYKKLKEIEKEC